jgi:hypothetical protein
MIITIATTLGFTNLTDSTSYTYLVLMSTGRRIGMALMMMPLQTAGLNQLPQQLNAHGTAISNTVRQVADAVGTSLLVTVMSDRTKSHLQDMIPTAAAKGLTQGKLIKEATIQGINDAYLVIIGIGIIGLLLSLFIKKVKQASQSESKANLEKVTKKS